MKTRCIVCEGDEGRKNNGTEKTMFLNSIIYMDVNSGLIKTDDICGKEKVVGTMHRGFAVEVIVINIIFIFTYKFRRKKL